MVNLGVYKSEIYLFHMKIDIDTDLKYVQFR